MSPDRPRAGVLTVSDRRAAGATDEAGPALEEALLELLDVTVNRAIVPDEIDAIQARIQTWCQDGYALVLTTGGTGFGPRDVTPEATRRLIERPAPGLVAAMIARGLGSTPYAMLSRADAGLRGHTLIVNLPGSPKGALESLEAIAPALPHGLKVARGEASDSDHETEP